MAIRETGASGLLKMKTKKGVSEETTGWESGYLWPGAREQKEKDWKAGGIYMGADAGISILDYKDGPNRSS